jgi:hypothetical protein
MSPPSPKSHRDRADIGLVLIADKYVHVQLAPRVLCTLLKPDDEISGGCNTSAGLPCWSAFLFHRFRQLDQYMVHSVQTYQTIARIFDIKGDIKDACGNGGQYDVVEIGRAS